MRFKYIPRNSTITLIVDMFNHVDLLCPTNVQEEEEIIPELILLNLSLGYRHGC
jgi:hypothetical protein